MNILKIYLPISYINAIFQLFCNCFVFRARKWCMKSGWISKRAPVFASLEYPLFIFRLKWERMWCMYCSLRVCRMRACLNKCVYEITTVVWMRYLWWKFSTYRGCEWMCFPYYQHLNSNHLYRHQKLRLLLFSVFLWLWFLPTCLIAFYCFIFFPRGSLFVRLCWLCLNV